MEEIEPVPTININGALNCLLLPSERIEHIKEQIGGANLESAAEVFGYLAFESGVEVLNTSNIYGIINGSIVGVFAL